MIKTHGIQERDDDLVHGISIHHYTLLGSSSFCTNYHTLSGRRSTVRAIRSGTKTLLITRLSIGAGLLGSAAGTLVEDVALVDGILLVAFCIALGLE
jgi:hypothetical protein